MRVNSFMMLAAFASDWAALSRLLDTPARWALRDLLAGLRSVHLDDAERQRVADEAVRTVLDGLPADRAAPLRSDGGTERFAGSLPSASHQGYVAMDLCMLVVDGNPMVGPVLGPLRERLLGAPALGLHDIGPVDSRLIVLTGADGERRIPSFQFEAGTMPYEIVLEVADVLRAETDPWGVADWWLSANAWTGTVPADLLGLGRDAELLGAALALAVSDGEV